MHAMFVTLDGATLRVRDVGKGQPVVLIHGWALDSDMWTPQLEDLSVDHRAIAFDRRGFGLSSGTPSLAADVEDLHSLFERLGIGAAGIVGMSQGARVAARFAHDYPQRARWLVLDGPPNLQAADPNVSLEIPLDKYRDRLTRGELATLRREWSIHPLMRLHTRDRGTHAVLRTMIDRYSGTDLTLPIEARHIALDLHALKPPVLVINGELDTRERHAAGEQIARTIPRARRSIVHHAGHLANLDNPTAYNALLRAFERDCSTAIEPPLKTTAKDDRS
jgi:pimeloyl-ACP methyl ester carboxylesterase